MPIPIDAIPLLCAIPAVLFICAGWVRLKELSSAAPAQRGRHLFWGLVGLLLGIGMIVGCVLLYVGGGE